MIVTIDCRDISNCKVTIVLCNGALVWKQIIQKIPPKDINNIHLNNSHLLPFMGVS